MNNNVFNYKRNKKPCPKQRAQHLNCRYNASDYHINGGNADHKQRRRENR
jgi:hypothetical protein